MIFLSENTLMKRDLHFEDIKPRLLGQLPPKDTYYNADLFDRPLGHLPRVILSV